MKENTEKHKSDIDFLLQTILDNPPDIDLGGFVILDNGLITSVSILQSAQRVSFQWNSLIYILFCVVAYEHHGYLFNCIAAVQSLII